MDTITNSMDDTLNTIWESILDVKYSAIYNYNLMNDLFSKSSVALNSAIATLEDVLTATYNEVTRKVDDHVVNTKTLIDESVNVLSGVIDGVKAGIDIEIAKKQQDTKDMIAFSFAILMAEINIIADYFIDPDLFFSVFEMTIDALW